MRQVIVLLVMVGMVCGIGGCAWGHKPAAAGTPFVRGRATVIDVQPELGLVVLDIDGQQINAYWQTEQTTAGHGTAGRVSALAAPVGVYEEPMVRKQTFPAQPGQMIDFVGMRTGNEIMLGRVSVVGK